ncbi:hypothetical protein C7N43_31670 [Sphingobacteriales bacterium UPWRP_1]|nr:hypothetical protein BVG80_01495 [Sphingobacteriales bacterium TSM_CSM]PSJ72925.1 hypothetical protein C7N43_31670 [Sphingobacteriales bacterium UPWRP_1]
MKNLFIFIAIMCILGSCKEEELRVEDLIANKYWHVESATIIESTEFLEVDAYGSLYDYFFEECERDDAIFFQMAGYEEAYKPVIIDHGAIKCCSLEEEQTDIDYTWSLSDDKVLWLTNSYGRGTMFIITFIDSKSLWLETCQITDLSNPKTYIITYKYKL